MFVEHMRIDPQRKPRVRMPQAICHQLGRHTLADEQSSCRVPDVVQADPRPTGQREQLPERLADVTRVEVRPLARSDRWWTPCAGWFDLIP